MAPRPLPGAMKTTLPLFNNVLTSANPSPSNRARRSFIATRVDPTLLTPRSNATYLVDLEAIHSPEAYRPDRAALPDARITAAHHLRTGQGYRSATHHPARPFVRCMRMLGGLIPSDWFQFQKSRSSVASRAAPPPPTHPP